MPLTPTCQGRQAICGQIPTSLLIALEGGVGVGMRAVVVVLVEYGVKVNARGIGPREDGGFVRRGSWVRIVGVCRSKPQLLGTFYACLIFHALSLPWASVHTHGSVLEKSTCEWMCFALELTV